MMSRFLLVHHLILIFLFIAAEAANTSNITTDLDALHALKTHITNDPTNFFAKNWNSSISFCNWTGVTCDVHSHRVTALNISHLSLSGTIPSRLGNLSSLQSLFLHSNQFSGSIPSSIFNIHTLKLLSFGDNQLSGIPSALSNCTYLRILRLSYNDFAGGIPKEIGNLTKLEELYLSFNGLQGEIPNEIGNLRNLEVLALGLNKLVGVIPAEIFNMSTIQGVGLQNNSLSGSLQSIPYVRLPNLEELYLWGNHFSGSIPNFIFNASKLSRLELQKNSFSGFIPSTFGNLRNLKRLGLNNNHLTSSTLELSFLSSLTNCKYLEFIDLSSNSIDGILSRKSVGNLSHSLKIFDMSDCNVSGSIPEEIGNLTNLIGFYLGGNNLNGSIPITLGKLQKLQVLYFPDNKLEGSIPDEVCRLAKVYQLDLSNNKLSGSIPACFGDLASLRNLSLASNELISVIPSTFWNLKDILYLNLSSNSLTGPLPLEIGNLKVLVKIDFSMNNFSGVIPNAIGGIKDLQFLFLEYNILQGSIPDSFGDLMSLKSLNLSNNNLSGSIPVSLEKLSYLKDLNLSFNKLEGEIPKGGSFGNFSAKSFEGNKLLCGSPNLHVPPCKTSIQHTRRKNTLLLGIFLPLSTIFMIAVILLIARNRKRGRQQPNDADMPQEATWRRFSYLELCQATDGFSENNLIGRGGFGSVYKARIQDGMEVAVKVFNQQCGRAFKSFDVECEVMKSIRHRNIIKIISCCSIVPIIHCDLKPSNVLFDNNMVAHLSDFGIAKLLIGEDQSLTQTQTLATIGYMAPEYGREGRVSTNGDVYSFGIMLIEVFTRKKPTDEIFSGEMTLRCWVNDLLPISVTEVVDANLLSQEDDHFVAKEECMSFVFNLAIKCTVESPEQRINAKEIVTGLSKIRDSLLRNVGAEQFKALALEYMPHGSLEKYLYSSNYILDIFQRLNIMIDVASALEYLYFGYSTPVIHCDLKPINVLLDDNMVAHLSDFGITKLLTGEDQFVTQTQTPATIGYMALGYGSEGRVSTNGDVYNFGVMLMETFTGKKPTNEIFNEGMTLKHWVNDWLLISIMKIVDGSLLSREDIQFVAKEQCMSFVFNMAMECTVESPEKRINAKEILP
ncbi:hypothetical protein CUMW_197840 [Citrus unshiu]|nr:hypothetical protein CUMW_197840 [Citrus unshiu]